ncbi:hypothetical protein TNCV_2284331 [Trichonephila clavipes]|nr:hypothetical protein TNCV_2284331 [Trichonephila clavipes]
MALGWSDVTPHPYDVMPFFEHSELSGQRNLLELEMALSDLKAKRKGLRQAFTLNLKKIESELNKEIADRKELSVLRTLIDDKF